MIETRSTEELRERSVVSLQERVEERGLQLALEECVGPSLVESKTRHSAKGTLADMGME